MKKIVFSQEQKNLLDSFERGEWRFIVNRKREISRHIETARAAINRYRRINLRMSCRDFMALETRAVEEGIPYQTFIANILHKFITGRLEEKKV